MAESADTRTFASRAGQKLDAALEAFGLDVRGMICADFGANVGGFTDCLLRHGAAKVFAVDAGYGELAWRLRNDPRVVVMERTNALYCRPPETVDLVTVDVGWTPQRLIVPSAVRWLRRPAPDGHGGWVVSLLKPHYELAKRQGHSPRGRLSDGEAQRVCLEVCRELCQAGYRVQAVMPSVQRGKGGNLEFLLLLGPACTTELRGNSSVDAPRAAQ